MQKTLKPILFIGLFALIVIPDIAISKIGVGVGTGKIHVDQSLRAGTIYGLPSVVVINTGTEASEYSIDVKHRENQPEMKPLKEWFRFEPETFYLEPGQAQTVEVKLSLPVKEVVPGDYFAFLSAYPKIKKDVGGTSLGIAAASKLYFTVAPSNFFVGVYYRAVSIVKIYSPWSFVLIGFFALCFLVAIFKRYFSLNIGINIKAK